MRRFAELIPLAVPEVRRLVTRIVRPIARDAAHWLDWSEWRRRHQAGAMRCHYKSRGHSP